MARNRTTSSQKTTNYLLADDVRQQHELFLALSRATQSLQQAKTVEDVYDAVGRQVKSLGHDAIILTLNEDGKHLHLSYLTFPQALIQAAMELTGLSVHNFDFPISPGGIYERIIRDGKGKFGTWTVDAVGQALPLVIRPMAERLTKLFQIEHSVIAPLRTVDGKILGTMTLASSFITEEDIPIVEALAAQTAISLNNVYLHQQMAKELAERKQAEEALRISQSTFEGIFNSVTDAIYIQDKNGTFLDVNQSAEKMYGYPREYFIGRTPEFLSAPNKNDFTRITEYLQQAFDGKPAEFEFWGMRKDGSIFPKDVRVSLGTYFGQKVIITVARDITERKAAEDALRESESKFHRVISETADGVALSDESGHIIEFNNAFEEITGQPRDAVLGQYLWDFQFSIRPRATRTTENYLQVKEAIQMVLLTGESLHLHNIMEVPFELSDGSLRYLQQRLFTIRTDKGWQLGSVSRDITEQKRAEETLRHSEERFRVLYEDNPSMYFTADANGVIQSVNKFGIEQLGYTVEELLGRSLLEMFHPEDTKTIQTQFKKCLENTQQTFQIEARKIHKNGTALWVRESARAVYDLHGQNVVLLICDDITEQKQAAEALATSEAELRALLASMQDTVLIIDRQGVYREIAPTSLSNFYVHPQDVVGKHLDDFFPADQVENFLHIINKVLDERRTIQVEYELIINGQAPWFEASVSPLNEECTVWVARDISERKQAEDELRRTKETLEQAHGELQKMFEYEQVLARTDGLTGIYNRRYFFELATREFGAALRYQRSLTLILFDVDGFKHANDTFGHAFGDRILKQVAQVTAVHVREVDILARYGGDEFIILLPEATAKQAYLIAERLRIHMASASIDTGTEPLLVTLSIGIAEMAHNHTDKSIEDVIRHADEALYNAKKSGRNHTSIFQHSE